MQGSFEKLPNCRRLKTIKNCTPHTSRRSAHCWKPSGFVALVGLLRALNRSISSLYRVSIVVPPLTVFSIVRVANFLMPKGTLRKIMTFLRKITVCSSLMPPLENKLRLKYSKHTRIKVHRYSFWKIERVIRICLKFQNLFKDLFWAKWNKKINMSPGFLRFYDVFENPPYIIKTKNSITHKTLW